MPATSCFLLLPPASPVFVPGSGKQKTAPKDRSKPLISLRKSGAGEGIRTLDPNLGKVVDILFGGIPGYPEPYQTIDLYLILTSLPHATRLPTHSDRGGV